MPFVDPNNMSENPYSGEPYFEGSGGGSLQGVNEELIYDDPDWENPDLAGQAQGGNPPLTTINQSGGYATVRLNQTLYLSGGIWLQGQISGSIPPGATFRAATTTTMGYPMCLRVSQGRARSTLKSEPPTIPV